jgi:phage gpG-like protein
MLEHEAVVLETSNGSLSGRTALETLTVAPWRALVVAAVLALVLGAALLEGVPGERSSVAPAVRAGGFSHTGFLGLPLAAQGPVSAAMGADSAAYLVSASNGGYAAANSTEHLSLRFDRSGVSLSSGATRVGLSLRAVGFGTSLTALGTVAPRAKANQVVYARAGLNEWYANGPLGLEQGFTITKAPSRHGAGPLTLSMALSGNTHVSLPSGGQTVTFRRTGAPSLRYSGLSATDASGRPLRSWIGLDAGQLLLRVDTRGARYPLRIDPFIEQQARLTGSGEEVNNARAGAKFGISVALSSDGNTALVGANEDNRIGAAWVFTREGSTWTQQGPKISDDEQSFGARFGASVALSSDGNTALIGGPGYHGTVGAAWVFTRNGTTWTQQAKLSAQEVGKAFSGFSVALSSDGNTAMVGGPEGRPGIGAAWVYTREGSTWTQQGPKLTGNKESGKGHFGRSVALSSDGSTALVGGTTDNGAIGAVWVFMREGSTWTQQGPKLTGIGEVGKGHFGASVALSSDGNTALVGAHEDNGVGAVWVFTREGSTWTQQGPKLTGEEEIGAGRFGESVALSSNGKTALVGGPFDDKHSGAAWVFTRKGSTWTQLGPKLTGTEETDKGDFGWTVALSPDGNTALVGDRVTDAHSAKNQPGAAWVFTHGAP